MDQAKMLRITVEESECAETIKLEGKIVGPWVEEWSLAWHELGPSLGGNQLKLVCAVWHSSMAKGGNSCVRSISRRRSLF